MKILLAEDELVSRTYLAKQLERLGYEVIVAEDGLAAWERFEREPVELVMTDIMMPGIDGLDLCRRIRTAPLPFYPVVILITTLTGKQWYLKGLEAGADDFLTKPATFFELVARLSVAEHTLHLERGMRHLEGFLGACPSCHSMRRPDGRWMPVRSFLATSSPPARHDQCPSCRDAKKNGAEVVAQASGCLA
jgi:CheY-like chemotaxis protein